MISHSPDLQGALQRLVRAGSAGLLLGDVPTGTAIALSLDGLATISAERPQVVRVTAKGRAFSLRGAYA